jgi:hypothetical protein
MLHARRVAVAVLLTVLSSACQAKDYFLTIGGGYSPTGNQISLEKNVQMYQRIVAELYPDGASHDIFFADGADPGRDLQFKDPQFAIPTVNSHLAEVLRQEDNLDLQYRSNELTGVAGPSRRESLDKWFGEASSKLAAGDRLVIYVTAHGGKSDDKNRGGNTKLHLWNGQNISMSDFASLLDKLPEGVSTAVVMVQCYSGGFANIAFAEGNKDKGISPRQRCGFYATVEDRPAAGCTADIDEENYEEYSSYFWAALVGHRRTGAPVDKPDYDGDGAVSFDEAHAFAVLQSPTIDIPVKTSDAALRAISKLQTPEQKDLLGADSRYDDLFKLASPAERAILDGLSTQLAFSQPERAKEAGERAKQLQEEKKQLGQQRNNKYNVYNGIAGEIARQLKQRWPELHNAWHPRVAKLLSDEASEVVQQIESHPRWQEMQKLEEEIIALDEQKLNKERDWCKCQRLIRTLENVALAGNLAQVASEEAQQQYAQLLAAEHATFGAASTPPAAVAASATSTVEESPTSIEATPPAE